KNFPSETPLPPTPFPITLFETMASVSPSRVRSLYRSLLRELPPLSEKPRSPLHAELRKAISSPAAPIEEADQLLSYLRSQRMYTTLIERYNPSLNMDTDERVRLSARRVGFDLPESN
ncbi:hypothetical protein RUND412_008369, partial [Rhizina undulata]